MKKNKLSLLISCFVLASCAVGPDFQRPQAPTVEHFTREADTDIALPVTTAASDVTPIKANWWEDFGSPAINTVVEMALQHNPNIEAGVANLEVAQRNVAAQQGLFFPSVQLGVGGTKQNTGNTLSPAINTSQSPPLTYTLMTKQVSVGFVPDVFGGNRRAVESLQAQADSQRYQLQALRITIASNVVASLIQEASLREQLRISERFVLIARQSLAHTQKMFEQGYASRIDLANQEMGVAQAVQALTQVRKSLDQTKDLIAVLCGKFPSEAIASIDLTQLTISALPQSIPSKLVEQRPDVLAAEENIRAANAQIGVAVANMLPQFSIVAASGGAAAVLDQALQSGNRYWSAGVGINQTVFAGGSLYARKKAAEAGTQAAIAQYQSTVLSAFQNVADTLYAYQNDSIAYTSSVDFEKSNLTVYQATRQQFDTGYASEPNLIAAEQGFLQSQLLKFQNLSIYYGDVVSLYQALGGGWQNTSPTH